MLENKIWTGDQLGQIARHIQAVTEEYRVTQTDYCGDLADAL